MTNPNVLPTGVRGSFSIITIRRPSHICDNGLHARNQPVMNESPHDVNSPPLNFSMATVMLNDCQLACAGSSQFKYWLQSGYIRWWNSGTYHFGEYKYQSTDLRRICFACGVLSDGGQNGYWVAVIDNVGYAVVDETIMIHTPPGHAPTAWQATSQFFSETKYQNTDIPGRVGARAKFHGLYRFDGTAWQAINCNQTDDVVPTANGWMSTESCTTPAQLETWDILPAG